MQLLNEIEHSIHSHRYLTGNKETQSSHYICIVIDLVVFLRDVRANIAL